MTALATTLGKPNIGPEALAGYAPEFGPSESAMASEAMGAQEMAMAQQPAAQEASRGFIRGSRIGNTLALAGIAFTGLMAGNVAKAEATDTLPVPSDPNVTQIIHVGKSTMRVGDFARATVMGNARSISKFKLNEAQQNGDCVTINGKKTPVWTEGHYEAGKAYGRDTRTSVFCEVNGEWYRKACGNHAEFTPPKKVVPGPIVWVNNYNNAKLRLVTVAKATAEAECQSADGLSSASAEGYGRSKAVVKMRLKNAMRFKGKNIKKAITKQYVKVKGYAQSKAWANANVVCEESGGNVVQHKDGTLTPQPPADAPGTNPEPSPNDPAPGGNECYDETNGQPVTPNSDGTCPVGSYGS